MKCILFGKRDIISILLFINVQKLHEKNNEKHNAFTILILLQLLDQKLESWELTGY